MDEANLCDRIALIQGGRILSIDTPANIIKAYPDNLYAIKADNMFHLLKNIAGYEKTLSSYAFGEYAHASFKDKLVNENEIKHYLEEHGLKNIEIKKTEATIEDSFIKLLKT